MLTTSVKAVIALVTMTAGQLASIDKAPVFYTQSVLPVSMEVAPPSPRPEPDEHQGHQHHTHSDNGLHTQETWQSIGKPGSQLAHLETAIYRIRPNTTETVTLELSSPLTSGELTISLTASKGLELANTPAEQHFNLSEGKEISIPLTVSADSEGQHILNLLVSHIGEDGQQQSRALAAAFNASATAQKLFTKSVVAKSYPSKIRLPAQEVIR